MAENVVKKEKDFSIASLVCGLLVWMPLFNTILGPLAIVFGIISIRRIKHCPERYDGQWMAIVGIILGSISTTSLLFYFYLTLFEPSLLVVR